MSVKGDKMAHLQKYTKGASGHMFKHYERAKDDKGQYIKFGNQDINPEKTHLNYNLAPKRDLSQGEFIKQRCSEIKVHNRKDINIMCSWVVSKPKGLEEEHTDRFFKATYEFLENRYGKENVISAYVHLDETTPHIHFAFVPVVEDRKKGGFKLSAKEKVNRKDLQTFHVDLSKHCEAVFGRDIGVLNEATREGNRSIDELKKGSAVKKLKDIENQAENALKIVSKARGDMEILKKDLTPLQVEYDAKKAYIKSCDKESDISMLYPDTVKVKKSLLGQETVVVPKDLWEKRHVSASEKNALKHATDEFEKHLAKFQKSTSAEAFARLQKKIEELKKENSDLRLEKAISDELFNRTDNQVDRLINRLNKVLDRFPDQISDRFKDLWNEEKIRENQRSYDFER